MQRSVKKERLKLSSTHQLVEFRVSDNNGIAPVKLLLFKYLQRIVKIRNYETTVISYRTINVSLPISGGIEPVN